MSIDIHKIPLISDFGEWSKMRVFRYFRKFCFIFPCGLENTLLSTLKPAYRTRVR